MTLALDLFCCAGGASRGLADAGFEVVGVDHKRHKHYPYRWIERDLSTADSVLDVIREVRPDFVASSPPCQQFSVATPKHARMNHANLIPTTRAAIIASGIPGWIENVHGAPLHHAIRLCGSMFPQTQKLRRHRFFELIGWWAMEPPHEHCTFDAISVAGKGPPDRHQSARYKARRCVQVSGHGAGGEVYAAMREEGYPLGQNSAGPECIRWREAMGWIDGPRDRYGLAQAIPPAYAKWLGEAFLARTVTP